MHRSGIYHWKKTQIRYEKETERERDRESETERAREIKKHISYTFNFSYRFFYFFSHSCSIFLCMRELPFFWKKKKKKKKLCKYDFLPLMRNIIPIQHSIPGNYKKIETRRIFEVWYWKRKMSVICQYENIIDVGVLLSYLHFDFQPSPFCCLVVVM